MFDRLSKGLSLVITLSYSIAKYSMDGGTILPGVFAVLVFPLCLIWFGDFMDFAKGGWVQGMPVTPTPSVLLIIAGWFLLTGWIVFDIYTHLHPDGY